jgi:sulfur dioxygenase
MFFRQLFDPQTSTFTYLLADSDTRHAVLIDPVRENVDRDATLIEELGFQLVATVETHVHADHVTGAWLLAQRFGSRIIYPRPSGVEGADLVNEGDVIRFGRHALEVRLTPGHTDSCATYVCDSQKVAFTGDALLIRGCGRTDFQQGDARRLYRSVWDQILSLPGDATLYPGHDYKGRTATTVREEREHNPRLGGGKTEDEFVAIMDNLNLSYPKRIDVALPANLALGRRDGDPGAVIRQRDPLAGATLSPAGVRHVNPAWVQEHGSNVRLVDVRQPEELAALPMAPGAELVPLSELLGAVQSWDRTAPVVLICRSSGRSDRAARALEQLGFLHVASMTGGMMAWSFGEPRLRA